MTLRRVPPSSVPALALLLAAGCSGPSAPPGPPGPRTITGERIRVESTGELDLLLMIDNSGSMGEEQWQLSTELWRLIGMLASGDRDGDELADFAPVDSMHIGIVTSDMGTAGFAVPTCDRGTFGTMFGDDGVLVTRGRTATPGCLASYPPVFEFVRGATDPIEYATEVSCVATTGTGGCGFEQQLEAALKAVSPSLPQVWTTPGYVPPIFFSGTHGHAVGANAGFVRAGSVLAIVLLTYEDDCSVSDPELFNMASTVFPGDLNLRCWMYEEQAVHPIARYARGEDGHGGLAGLRRDPGRLVFAPIVGVPVDSVPAEGNDYDAMLAHRDMQLLLDPDAPTTAPRLRPSCNTANGIAFPPRRIVRVAQALERVGASTTVQSICQSSYVGALGVIVDRIADALDATCLQGELAADAEGLVDCALFEVLPVDAGVSCDELAGRSDGGTTIVAGEERPVCEVTQVGPDGLSTREPGWVYAGASSSPEVAALCGADGAQVVLTVEAFLDAEYHLECPAR